MTLETNDEEQEGTTPREKRVKKNSSQWSGVGTSKDAEAIPKPVDSSDDEVQGQPAWGSEIDSFVVNLLKDYVEILD